MTIEEILKSDTSNSSISELLNKLSSDGHNPTQQEIYRIRRKLENDSGIPMEEDDIGKGEAEEMEKTFPSIVRKLSDENDNLGD